MKNTFGLTVGVAIFVLILGVALIVMQGVPKLYGLILIGGDALLTIIFILMRGKKSKNSGR